MGWKVVSVVSPVLRDCFLQCAGKSRSYLLHRPEISICFERVLALWLPIVYVAHHMPSLPILKLYAVVSFKTSTSRRYK